MKRGKNWITLGCLALAALLIGLGLMDEGQLDVLNKARFICFECMGIG